jgi:hypothetical protein
MAGERWEDHCLEGSNARALVDSADAPVEADDEFEAPGTENSAADADSLCDRVVVVRACELECEWEDEDVELTLLELELELELELDELVRGAASAGKPATAGVGRIGEWEVVVAVVVAVGSDGTA